MEKLETSLLQSRSTFFWLDFHSKCSGYNIFFLTQAANTVTCSLPKGILCKRQVCVSDTKNKRRLYLLQVKVDFRLKFFSPRLILNFFCLLALIIRARRQKKLRIIIIHELGQGDKGNENQARLNQNKPEIKFDL